MDPLFLGIDCSTQSLTGIVIDFKDRKIIFKESLIYDKILPEYETRNGVIYFDDPKKIHSNPRMWVDALEILFRKIRKKGDIITRIQAISGSAQQHGTVYLNSLFNGKLQKLKFDRSLSEQINDTFSRETSPIWMDSSTTNQCQEIRKALGGSKETIKITGSDTFERFSGPQIRKFYQENPQGYKETSSIHLVSSFLASILLGKNAPIDYSDGSGMNLMNIKRKEWDEKALDATAPNLKEKLPSLVSSNSIIGNISPYFTRKYNFPKSARLIVWSGDNPNSLVGTGLVEKGTFAISLGTSDTFFGYLDNFKFDLKGEGHLFRAPIGNYMSLICFKNGSLTRERIKTVFGLSWSDVSEILEKTIPGNKGKIILPYIFPEIVPLVLEPRIYRFGLEDNDIEGNIRGIIEAQFLSMRLHSKWIDEKPKRIYATGGGSKNTQILQIIADIFQSLVERFKIPDSAALGAALRAAYSFYQYQKTPYNWKNLTDMFLEQFKISKVYPNENVASLYNEMLELYKAYEDFILRNGKNPEQQRLKFKNKFFD